MELNIAGDQPLFQLQAPRRSTTHESHPSAACFDAGSPSKHRPKIPKKAKNLKSLSELENYELKGFADLGFMFHKEILSPQLINILPGLQRLKAKCGDTEETREVDEEHVKRPYLSEAWSTRRADSPPLDPQILFKPQQAEMQNHLRFWARNVASMIRHDHDAC